MSQSCVKECIFCKAKIRMSDEGGKWLPYNLDGSLHECKERKNGKNDIQGQKVTATTKQESKSKEITLAMVQRKLESIGIIINLERLMKTLLR